MAGISESQLHRYVAEQSQPTVDPLIAIARAGGVSVEWLATGEGPMRPEERQAAPPAGGEIGVEFVLVPRYDVEASAGGGAVIERESEIGRLAFRKDWLRQKGLQAKDAAVIRVKGDSMAPTIREGSLVLVDTRKERPKEDGIYVLMVDGHLMAKRLQLDLASGGLYIRSDNPAYREQHLTKEQASHLYIIGRVVWAGGEV